MIHVVLPAHLRTLAGLSSELELDVEGPVTTRSILDALEARYPMLLGTVRDHVSGQRRPFVRFFACGEDLSHDPPDTPLPDVVASGKEPFLIVGAIAGGCWSCFRVIVDHDRTGVVARASACQRCLQARLSKCGFPKFGSDHLEGRG